MRLATKRYNLTQGSPRESTGSTDFVRHSIMSIHLMLMKRCVDREIYPKVNSSSATYLRLTHPSISTSVPSPKLWYVRPFHIKLLLIPYPPPAIPALSSNHTPEFAIATRTIAAHTATLKVTKVLAGVGVRVLADEAYLEEVGFFFFLFFYLLLLSLIMM